MYDSIMSVSARNALSRLSETVAEKGVGSASAPQAVPATPGASFCEVLSQMTGSVSQKLQAAEATSIQGIKGDAPVRDVVSSVMEAEQSLQTAIAIRDKIVQAYLEISRMPI
ncbi:flagellar hook-basal body complex protein FliE [Brucella melitensis]|uniref:flagellar hook-basal body complex protein FliE n=1 Tax=Brucella melitensis TaxID=29459 RepID=UPI0001B58C39|nr:flagellar hook-basal body complex protein FliE [Brucella melitensis]AIJ86816.1 flagellar hook-basal body complex FliE family protein [Brucella melitensis bv. 3 str. Ether]AOG50990.1 flagellar hook-basal body complex protein FliE [Brucella melitensis]ARY25894.1 flagellar hook-basal body complex protein FliE [Brucella melitensis]ARY29052.1 flagellar hook-basal body complex protein FliE [Brucella melitensis]ARY38537.1 flagellar hook-basal body complex protein FliE [Brucella melitensis]